ncbi:Glycylpeptide N-tetradecanoyltransferase [Candida parapsilosis]|uniref:Glycylpeptide N-tetradecanoyltransferase n=2 Tax=Candida parapsilosis TaxID=5480 RepID=G8BI37_CANPC|nr:uncharacterized protein CPAR2_401040 [Candida parapsilosis]KAF6046996.1 Glycylpeptide N-tetradecanoyltransferase [Candida parapsilosis]KAF6047391.1 Glycylpeptide N-tetradecanoyltransferase [Candida parapsilosis]KAF6050638.1 Glycylpeptide N-tetradecanoyltransferase [Candida parapsilosis]KAF6061757.1 Glycylpeptide N-tetradecanoyltransferase [Candida parapsilosis]KAI5902443.1 Glycylpeptide N-tetradecanoyltransferase [Candida parapsilosis]
MSEKKSIQDLLNMLALGETLSPSQEKKMKDHLFWNSQPVPKLDEAIKEEGPIDAPKTPADVPDKPFPLLPEFGWSTVDIDDDKQINELYDLLYENYVEDTDATFRFKYTRDFFKWALKPPGWKKEWYAGVRVKSSNRLIAFIAATPVTIKLNKSNKTMDGVEINFLCIHKKLRNKRLAPILIKEITRRVNKENIWQALYTGGAILPTPLATCRYQHRPLNWPKLYDVGFSHLPADKTKANMIAQYALPNTTQLPGLRKMTEADVPSTLNLLNEYQKRFDIVQEFTEEEFKHWMLGQESVIKAYVVEKEGKITDFVSYYLLPFTVLENKLHDELGVAYLYYYATDAKENYKTKLTDLMNDALITAKSFDADVFNCLTCQDNTFFLKPCKFGSGDGFLNYYLFNYRTFPLNGGIDKETKQVEENQTSGIGVILL